MSKEFSCYCPYCGKILEVDGAPGDYQCGECNSSFRLSDAMATCPGCGDTLILNRGPGVYHCSSCSTVVKIGTGRRVLNWNDNFKCCLGCGVRTSPTVFGPNQWEWYRCRECKTSLCRDCAKKRKAKSCPICASKMWPMKLK